jgi:hypothetical protein
MLITLVQGCGALISASVVDLHHPLSYRRHYLDNAAVTLASRAFFATPWKCGHVDHLENVSGATAAGSDGGLVVVRDR